MRNWCLGGAASAVVRGIEGDMVATGLVVTGFVVAGLAAGAWAVTGLAA